MNVIINFSNTLFCNKSNTFRGNFRSHSHYSTFSFFRFALVLMSFLKFSSSSLHIINQQLDPSPPLLGLHHITPSNNTLHQNFTSHKSAWEMPTIYLYSVPCIPLQCSYRSIQQIYVSTFLWNPSFLNFCCF